MNKYGQLSLLMVGICVLLSFFINETNDYPGIFLLVIIILSIAGVIFAFLSRKLTNIIFGVVLNCATFILLFFLLLSMGIGEA
ncbi:hypothetical protein [Bacillus sp. USDA818B3_A]|uniref:hypothetical protein n=1 Tax=Bacillus sp. USDA818B3_A TaxID=2698834 RepID=UPI0013696131|nr:hypothetical protein [Bacillus sp. USDA818B3_A]